MTDNKYYISHFTHQELACKQTGKIILAPGFAEKLVDLRSQFNQPMRVTSACRSRKHNHKIGGSPTSFHVYDFPAYPTNGCCAVDVATADNTAKGDLIATAWNMGWSIGINRNFVHLDRRIDYTKLKQIVFVY